LLYRWLSSLQIRRLYAEGKNSGLFCEHLLSITPEGLTDKTEFVEIRSAWKGVERLEVTPDYAFVYFNSVMAHIISRKRVVEGDFDAFVGELRRSVMEPLPKHDISSQKNERD
jgi:isocitrate dehydrogenase kinase/phosphatase